MSGRFAFDPKRDIDELYGMRQLHCAAREGHAAVVKILLDKDADVDICSIMRGTPLYLAAKKGHAAVVETLLAHDADVNTVGPYCEIPFHLAAKEGYIDIVKAFINHGADVNKRDFGHKTARDLAEEKGHTAIALFLRTKEEEVVTAGNTPRMGL